LQQCDPTINSVQSVVTRIVKVRWCRGSMGKEGGPSAKALGAVSAGGSAPGRGNTGERSGL